MCHRKGKGTCWDIMKDDNVIVEALTQLGQSWDLSEDIEKVLEKFVCKLYRSRKNSVNEVRFQLFERKQKKGVISKSAPPSKSALHLHFERANYVARIWKLAGTAMVSPPSPAGCGWDVDGDVEWIEDMFPDDITTLFLGLEMDSESDNDSDSEDSDSDDEHYREEESDGEEDYDGDNDDDDDLSY